MTEWMLSIDEIEDIACPVNGVVDGQDCTNCCSICDLQLLAIAHTAQRKLLEYLINLTDVIGYSVFTGQRAELLQRMIDKLEANNG